MRETGARKGGGVSKANNKSEGMFPVRVGNVQEKNDKGTVIKLGGSDSGWSDGRLVETKDDEYRSAFTR